MLIMKIIIHLIFNHLVDSEEEIIYDCIPFDDNYDNDNESSPDTF